MGRIWYFSVLILSYFRFACDTLVEVVLLNEFMSLAFYFGYTYIHKYS